MTNKFKVLLHESIYNKDGQIVLLQLPNVPLLIFLVASVLTRVLPSGSTNDVFKSLAFGSIFTWACLEIFTGVNYFRRVLGLLVLGLSIMSAVLFLRSGN